MTEFRAEDIILGNSAPIRELRKMIHRIAPTSVPVLIEGPTGSGKELVAQAIHRLSGRTGALVAFNACALGESMFEDALFGHRKGAFTGALNDHIGLIGEANGGTLFLDEIGSLAGSAQAKLLRVIETRQYRRIGTSRDAQSDFRLISATNESLEALVEERRFRADLMWRVRGIVLSVPGLPERIEDVPLLAERFGSECGRTLSAEAIEVLLAHEWTGNVRELRQVVLAAASTALSDRVAASHLKRILVRRQPVTLFEVSDADRLLDLLRSVRGDVSAAAEMLGVHPVTIYRRLKRLGCSSRALRRTLVVSASNQYGQDRAPPLQTEPDVSE